MRQSGKEDRNLSEVKAVLHRLRSLPSEPQPALPQRAEIGFRRGYLIGIASTTTVMVTAALVLVFGFVLPGFETSAPSPPKQTTATPKQETSAPKNDPNRQAAPLKLPVATGVRPGTAVEERSGASATVSSEAAEAAQALMSSGRVQAARQRLLALAPDGSPHVAWALARSYDPNHLKQIQGADAAPDVAEAARWYRTWHTAAVKQHVISDSVSLEKIIGAMRP